jgi:ankyrin repeat protein
MQSKDSKFSQDRISPKPLLTESCLGLVVLGEAASCLKPKVTVQEVHFAHLSFRDYFQENRSDLYPDGEKAIALACLSYLCRDDFLQFVRKSDDPWKICDAFPLADYAARCWGEHATTVSYDNEIRQKCLRYVGRQQTVMAWTALAFFPQLDPRLCVTFIPPKDMHGIHVAARLGMEWLLQLILDGGADPNCQNSFMQTPLIIAAEAGFELVVGLLLNTPDIDVNLSDSDGDTPLSNAARAGHEKIVELLITSPRETQINGRNEAQETPLVLAARFGREKVVDLLLRNNADGNVQDKNLDTPLHAAARIGDSQVIGILLSYSKIDPNLRNSDGRSPLDLSIRELVPVSIIKQFVDCTRVNINLQDDNGDTALHTAISFGRDAVVSMLLLRPDIDPNLANEKHWTPLELCLSNYYETNDEIMEEEEVFAIWPKRIKIAGMLKSHPKVVQKDPKAPHVEGIWEPWLKGETREELSIERLRAREEVFFDRNVRKRRLDELEYLRFALMWVE